MWQRQIERLTQQALINQSIGQSQAAGSLLPKLVCSLMLRGTHSMISPNSMLLQRKFPSSPHQPQLYSIATYDALFKHVLSKDKIRPSFFHAFIPELPIVSSERLNDHMNPVQGLQLLRTFLHSKKTEDVVKKFTPDSGFEVNRKDSMTKKLKRDEKAATFLYEIVSRLEDIKRAFPEDRFDGTMDFVCRLENNSYALVEMQVVPYNYWDKRALAYVAAFYGNQLFKRGKWKDIKKVIGINILGGGKENKAHWVDTPTQFVRHYKVQEQLHLPSGYIDGIELIQYSLMNAPKASDDQEKQDWITFFKDGYSMTEEQVQQKIKTPEVLEAFKRVKIKSLPPKVLAAYEAEDVEYDCYSEHTEDIAQKREARGRAEGRAEGLLEGLLEALMGLIQRGKLTIDDVMQSDDYSPELKKELEKRLPPKKG